MQSGWDSLPAYLTLRQVAELFGVHPNTVRNWDRSGRLRSVRLGLRGDRRYDKEGVYRLFREEYSRVEGRILTNGAPNGSAAKSVAVDAPPSTVGPLPVRRRIPFLARLRARLTDRSAYRRWNRIRALASSAPRRRIAALPPRSRTAPAAVLTSVLGVVVLATVALVVARSPLVHREPPGATPSTSSTPVAVAGTDRTFDVLDSEATSPTTAPPAAPVTIAANDQPDIVIGGGEASAPGEAVEPSPPIAAVTTTPTPPAGPSEPQADAVASTVGENREVVVGGAKPVGIEPPLPLPEVRQPETVVEPGSASAIAVAPTDEALSAGVVAGASEVAAIAPPAPTVPAVPVGVPKIPANPVGMALAWVSLTFGTFFFIYSFRYYSIVAVVLALSRSGVPGNGYANGNGKNGNGYRNGYAIGNGKWNGNGTARGAKGFLAGIFKKNGPSKGFRPGFTGLTNGNGARPRHPSFLFNLFFGDESAEKANGRNGRGNGYANGKNSRANGNGPTRYRAGYFGVNGNGKNGRWDRNGNGGNGRWNGNGKAAYTRFFQGLFKKNGNGYRNGNGRNGNGYRNGNGNGHAPVGMLWDLSGVELEKLPFVSVHIPFYNEKKVANRILTACTSFDYPNYEVIVVDDSTDETVRILEKWKRHPKVKVIHRDVRTGFKGGALKQAVAQMDPRSAFVVVFDADFVPYPDTLTQFLRYFRVGNGHTEDYKSTNLAAVQGYQWHVLNKNENWITRAVRAEFAGSYVIERPGTEIFGALKQIAGSVYMIRADVLKKYGWGTSITEDFELTLKLYTDGYRVLYTPYVQGPSECVSTLKRLIRQRMRWAEGHTHNVRKSFRKILASPYLRRREKVEFLYLAPYYLQAVFFMVGTLGWFVSDAVMHTRLPFWTELWGWSLVFTNLFALPLVNAVGLFLEESPQRDYLGIFSFVVLSYVLVPFQAWAALKGLVEKSEGPWFRTPKSGHITDAFFRSRFRRWFGSLFPGAAGNRALAAEQALALNPYLARPSAHDGFRKFGIAPSPLKWVGNAAFTFTVVLTALVVAFAPFIPTVSVRAQPPPRVLSLDTPREPQPLEGQELQRFADAEAIFHREPRVRFQLGNQNFEVTTTSAGGLGRARRTTAESAGGVYRYRGIFPDADLVYTVQEGRVLETLELARYQPIEYLEQRLVLNDLVVVAASVGDIAGSLAFAPKSGGTPVFSAGQPSLYEVNNPAVRSEGVKYELSGSGDTRVLRKVLTEEGKHWLADPARQFPVALDPTTERSSPLTTGYTSIEAQFGSLERKIAYSVAAGAWYVVLADAGVIQYKKCLVSSLCDANGDWGSAVNVDVDGDAGDVNPSVIADGNTTLWFVWIDNATVNTSACCNAIDSVQFRSLNTSTDTFGGECSSTDEGSINDDNVPFLAVDGGGDMLLGQTNVVNGGGPDTEQSVWDFPFGTTCSSPGTGFSADLIGTSGLPANPVSVVAIGDAFNGEDHAQLIYSDSVGVAVNHSLYDLTNNSWTFTDKSSGLSVLFGVNFSVTTDGSSLWLIAPAASNDVAMRKCDSTCATSSGGAWASVTQPWASTELSTNVEGVNVTYLTTDTDLRACLISGRVSSARQQVHCRNTDTTTIAWGTEDNPEFAQTDFSQLSTPLKVDTDANMAVVVSDNAAYYFATQKTYSPIVRSELTSGVSTLSAQFGGPGRRIAYMPNATGGAAWYVVHSDVSLTKIVYYKCAVSASKKCDVDSDWSDAVNFDVDGDAGDYNPNIWVGLDDNSFVVTWVDENTVNSSACCNATESIQYRYLNTTNDTFGGQCSSTNQGTLGTTVYTYMAQPASGTDSIVGYHDSSTDTEDDIWEVTNNWSCGGGPGTGMTSRKTGSGIPAGGTASLPVAISGATTKVHVVYADGANTINHSVIDLGTSGTANATWDFADQVADAGAVLDARSLSVTTDGTNLFLLYMDTATTTVLQKCSGTCLTSGAGTWTNLTAPWTSGLTSAEDAVLTYLTTDTDFFACINDNYTIRCKFTDATTISWSSEFTLGFRDGFTKAELSIVADATTAAKIGLTLYDGYSASAGLRFATVPERALMLLFLSPLLPGALARLRRARRHRTSNEWKA